MAGIELLDPYRDRTLQDTAEQATHYEGDVRIRKYLWKLTVEQFERRWSWLPWFLRWKVKGTYAVGHYSRALRTAEDLAADRPTVKCKPVVLWYFSSKGKP